MSHVMGPRLLFRVLEGIENERETWGDEFTNERVRVATSVPFGTVIEEYDGWFDEATPAQEISLAIQQFDIGVL